MVGNNVHRNSRQTGMLRFPPHEPVPPTVTVRPMTEDEKRRYGMVPSTKEVEAMKPVKELVAEPMLGVTPTIQLAGSAGAKIGDKPRKTAPRKRGGKAAYKPERDALQAEVQALWQQWDEIQWMLDHWEREHAEVPGLVHGIQILRRHLAQQGGAHSEVTK